MGAKSTVLQLGPESHTPTVGIGVEFFIRSCLARGKQEWSKPQDCSVHDRNPQGSPFDSAVRLLIAGARREFGNCDRNLVAVVFSDFISGSCSLCAQTCLT